jgi:hypothetical protein
MEGIRLRKCFAASAERVCRTGRGTFGRNVSTSVFKAFSPGLQTIMSSGFRWHHSWLVFARWSDIFKTGKPIHCLSRKITDQHSKMKIWEALEHLQPALKISTSAGSWRTSNTFFKPDYECSLAKPGVVTMSPAWFEQAQDVSHALLLVHHNS